MASTEIVLELDAAVFLDDILSFVYEYYGIDKTALIPSRPRSWYRENADYRFSPEIGNAILHVLREFSNMAESTIELSNIISLSGPIPSSPLGNFIMCHNAAYLTDDDFINNPSMWCSSLFDILVKVSSLCIHFEQYDPPEDSTDIKVVAASVLYRLMNTLTQQKIDLFVSYARKVPDTRPRAQIYMFIMD